MFKTEKWENPLQENTLNSSSATENSIQDYNWPK